MYLRFLCYFSTKISDAIITISEYSKNDILKHYDLNPDKVKVVYPSINTEFIPLNLSSKERNEIKSYLHLPKYVILYVGVIENRKNIFGILNVADEIYKRNKNIGFLLVGRLGYGNRKILSAIKKKKNVILQTSIDDLMLKKIYNISDIFLFPSFYEGFGYPPLEAMRCGIPVIASNNTSLKEVIGDGGILRDPHDHHIMADDIMNILKDEELYAEMQGKGMKQAKKFTSENYVLGMLNVFNSFSKQ
jgi:glycosyltransferase involved in cell wall biosynthesis